MNDHLNDIRTIGIIAHIDAVASDSDSELVETVRLSKAALQLTGGRGSFSMDPCGYRAVGS